MEKESMKLDQGGLSVTPSMRLWAMTCRSAFALASNSQSFRLKKLSSVVPKANFSQSFASSRRSRRPADEFP
jgi:hypothetical protein